VSEEEKASRGRVDYVFKLQGVSRFYLEAKALRIDLNKQEFTKQVTTYAYNKGTTWAILSNFEDLRVFNAQTGQGCLSLAYSDYLSKLDDLWLLSRESFEKNALDAWAETHGVLPPRLGIEQRLYEQLRLWREELFTQLHHYNEKLTFIQIDEVIQRFFNRLIFIRTSEDRQIENRVLLGAVHEWRSSGRKGELIQVLQRIFHEFDGYYDSDLFALHLVDQVYIESTTVENIITGLYDIPRTVASYDFSVIDADVLGAVYEQYLGHVATIAKQRVQEAQARMNLGIATEPVFELTAKKQHRKEQGIYYTPKFVTDYIVKETVGRFIQEHNHHDIMSMKILDPACGSGSFLIRAYDELLRYHADQRGKSVLELDQFERLPVLTGNIFGVDLDMQAVEIARLNLLLRSLARREMLPTLADNIRCGNSLISGTEKELESYFGDGWKKVKPFNWNEELPDIMKNGGFDVVIGNPPYVRFSSLQEQEKNYYKNFNKSAFKQYDLYVLFIEKAISLLKTGGRLGFITSSKFFASDYGEQIRKYILDNCCIEKVIDVSNLSVFKDAAIYPFIFIFLKEDSSEKRNINTVDVVTDIVTGEKFKELNQVTRPVKQTHFLSLSKNIFDISYMPTNILDKIESQSISLGSIFGITRGFRPPPEELLISRAKYVLLDKSERTVYKKFIKAKDIIAPYALNWTGSFIKYEQEKILESKPTTVFENPKIMVPDISYHPKAYYDREGIYCLKTIYLILKDKPTSYELAYLTCILNSKLIDFFFRKRFSSMHMGGGYLRFRKQYIEQIPVHKIDFNNDKQKNRHDNLVYICGKILDLNNELAPIRNVDSNERDELQRQIEHTDREIDNLVYDLYGLTDTERKIIEESGSQASDNRGT